MATNKNIRSEYIKNLMEDKEELNKSLVESTKEALKDIVDEAVNKNLRSLISESDKEDDDEFKEEEVDSKDFELDTDGSEDGEEGTEDITVDVDASTEDEIGEPEISDDTETEIDVDVDTVDDATGDEDVWSSLEQYKDEDGEYDLTGMDGDEVVKVLKVMKPEDGDGVRVIKKDDGNLKLIDDANDAEYLIVLDDECEDGECELGESVVNEGEVNLGYTDNYQDKTAMTMDTDDGAKTRKWNAGTPTGNGKRWVGNKGDMSPFNKNVNEADEDECIIEVEMDECGDAPVMDESAMTMSNKRTDREPNMEDNGHERERRHRNHTGVNPTMNKSANESVARQLKAMQNENKQLKKIAEQMRERLNEAVVINASLGKIVKLVTENTTTRDEKINIVNRFNDVQTVKESNQLYESISKELKNAHPINNTVDKVMNGQIAESKKNVVETQLYECDDLSSTRDLMHRLDKIK